MNLRHVAGFAIIAAAIGACVIAEPATELPDVPAQPPRIVRTGVVPSPTVVLTRWPQKFIVPVELADPRETFAYATFVDYNPLTGDGFGIPFVSTFELRATVGSTRVLEVLIDERIGDKCQVVEVVVAPRLNEQNPHLPQEPGGPIDSVSWFYSPGGDLAGCPTLPSGLTPDAEALLSIDAALPAVQP